MRIVYRSALKLHDKQRAARDSPARFVVIAAGRRAGKTAGALDKIAEAACQDPRGHQALYWWCAPTYKRSIKAWEEFGRVLKQVIRESRRTELKHHLINGVLVEFVSLEKWENLKGDGLCGCVIDEAARCPRQAYYELIRPALADKKGWCWIISTPLGKNWFFEEFSKTGPDRASFVFPSRANPYLDPEEIESAQRDMPADLFLQEFEAKFLDEAASFFQNLHLCRPLENERGYLRGPLPTERCYIGADLGRYRDFSVFTVVARSEQSPRLQVIGWERINQVAWAEQESRIINLSTIYQAPVWIDASGPGDRVVEELQGRGLEVVPFKFQSPTQREELIQALKVEIASGRVSIPTDLSVLWRELTVFEYKLTRGGKLTSAAPDGEHDDAVMSLALAVRAATKDTRLTGVDLKQFTRQDILIPAPQVAFPIERRYFT